MDEENVRPDVQSLVKNVGHLVLKILGGHYDTNAKVKKRQVGLGEGD